MLKRSAPHLLVVNVYFTPNSFGGATIVAENMASLLKFNHGWKVTVLTTIMDSSIMPYSLMRYESKGLSIIAINLPNSLTYEEFYNNPKIRDIVSKLTIQIDPDIAHIHSIQTLGGGVLEALEAAQVPTAVTVHDCWWICERQFMIKPNNQYCYQERIDLNICSHCVDDPQKTYKRFDYLMGLLKRMDCLFFPSEFQMQLFLANGFDPERCFVNRNGILVPPEGYKKLTSPNETHKVRFGFVGGPGPIKGFDLVKEAFLKLERSDYELVIVDAGQNINTTWRYEFDINIRGKITIFPAYSQDTIDDFFGTIDVLLFPSMWKESFGLTVREALARNVWVIASNGGGTVEDCIHGENSTIIPMLNDSQYLYEAITQTFNQNWAAYRNPHLVALQNINAQAEQLSDLLKAFIPVLKVNND